MADDELHLDRLKEGLCPVHRTPLERRDDNGWCEECGTGWSLRQDEVGVHFEFSDPTESVGSPTNDGPPDSDDPEVLP